jgi:hypothetical protein
MPADAGIHKTKKALDFSFPAFALARRNATARKREDKLQGMTNLWATGSFYYQ